MPWVYEKARWGEETANDWLLSRDDGDVGLFFFDMVSQTELRDLPLNMSLIMSWIIFCMSHWVSYNLCLRWCWPTDVARKFNEKFYSHQKSRPRFKENMNIALLLESVPWTAKTCGVCWVNTTFMHNPDKLMSPLSWGISNEYTIERRDVAPDKPELLAHPSSWNQQDWVKLLVSEVWSFNVLLCQLWSK